MPDEVERTLRACSFEVSVLRRSPSFVQLQVEGEGEVVVLDLVAEPVPACELPQEEPVGLQRILVDTRHEILVDELGTLLHRFEPRDLVDLRELIARGGDLGRAMQDAAKKDGGFSPLTLGFCLDGFDAAVRARALGMSEAEAVALDGFRRELRDRIAALARP